MTTLVAASSCGDAPPKFSEPTAPIAQKKEPFSTFGVERLIPLRIVMMANDCVSPTTDWNCGGTLPPQPCTPCTSGTNCGPDTGNYAQMRTALQQANTSLRPLGVQFYISRIEKYKMPTFYNKAPNDPAANPPYYTWSAVRDELRLVYPNLPLTEFPSGTDRWEHDWLHAVTVRAGDPREVIIWLAGCAGWGFDGARPWQGAASLIADDRMFADPRTFAHELAHIVGLEHTMYPAQARNPEIASDSSWANAWEYWDLYYGVQNGLPVYFSSSSAAYNWAWGSYPPRPLYPKHNWDPNGANQNCWMDANCTVTCCINGVLDPVTHACIGGQVETTGTAGIAGLGFTFAGDNPGAGVFRRGQSGMAYLDPPFGAACPYVSFSESQAEQVKRTLRSDIRIDNPGIFASYSAGYTAQRQVLGDYRARSGFDQLDFDGDGQRDIAVWQPPQEPAGFCGDAVCGLGETAATCASDCPGNCGNGFCTGTEAASCPRDCGRFRVLTSSSAFTSVLERNLGRLGDVPVPGYYDNDNIVDFAVLRRGGLTAEDPFDSTFWWIWCKSTQSHDCANPNWLDWGWQYDVPLPNLEFDGNTATREVAVYRPLQRYVYWKTTDWSNSSGIPVGSNVGSRTSHLHGLYDNDWKTDLVFYNPGSATFFMLLSTNGWSSAQGLLRTFPATLKADAIAASSAGSGAPAVRHGGMPLPAQYFNWAIPGTRRALRAWDPYTGNWHTMWNPVTSTALQTCQWGAPRDLPVAGPLDRDGNLMTDMVVYRPTHTTPTVCIKSQPNSADCGSNIFQFTMPGTPRSQLWAVTDMNGDYKGDFLIFEPDSYSWAPWYQQPNGSYFTPGNFQLGGPGDMPL